MLSQGTCTQGCSVMAWSSQVTGSFLMLGGSVKLVGAFSGHLHTGLECHGMVTTGNWQLLDVGWVSQTHRCFLRALAHRATWSACTSSLSVLHKYRAALGVHAENWAGMSTGNRPADVLPCQPRGPASAAAPAARRARRLMPRLHSRARRAGCSSH